MILNIVLGVLAVGIVFVTGNRLSVIVRPTIEAGDFRFDTATLAEAFLPPWPISTHEADLIVGAGFVAVAALVWLYQVAGKQASRPGEEYGTAKWGKPSQIRPFINKTYGDNVLFTVTERLSFDSYKTQRNLNSLVIGSSGSGKSRYFVLPNLNQMSTSYVVTDPKGELYAQTAARLESAGYAVRCLNLIDLDQSNKFNLFHYFSDEHGEVDTQVLTENIVANTNGRNPKNGGDFWEKTERALLNALVSYVYYTKGRDGTLNDVTELLADMSASEENENAISTVDGRFMAIPEILEEVDEAPQNFDAEAQAALKGLSFAHSQYNTFLQGAGETKKSIIISLGVRLAPLHISEVKHLLAEDTISVDTIGDKPTALFLIVSDMDPTFNFLAAIFYEILFERNMRRADRRPDRRLAVPVQCFMDEFANVGLIPGFERKIAVMRSRGISANVIVQTYAQGKALYKDHWETIVGNCDSLLFLGGAEESTTKFIANRLGKETIYTKDNSESRGSTGSWSQSTRKLGRELLTQDEIARLPTNECLYFLRGLPAFRSRKLPAPA